MELKALERADKRAYVDGIPDEAEAAARRQNMRTLYKKIYVLSGTATNHLRMH